MINMIIIIKTLFLLKLDNKFSLGVLALKQLNIPMKINKAKKAVIRYLSVPLVR